MVFTNFTANDIRRIAKNDLSGIRGRACKMERRVMRDALKMKRFPTLVYRMLTTEDKNRYLLVYTVIGKRKSYLGVFLVSNDGRAMYQVSLEGDYGECVTALSAHFFERYKQRTRCPYSGDQLRAYYIYKNSSLAMIYESGDRLVYATEEGLALTQYDPKTGIRWYKTFVSNDMLGETQRRAKEEVESIVRESDNGIHDAQEEFETTTRMFRLAMNRTVPITSEIYNRYYEDN